ncbi:ankyrin repeat gene family protein [Fowlpox virus]|uniref:Putative ankyrin repeat protein FPV018 n=2 Tax=Fowlpox virus TaxID=10261 RepID=V018_FOWPN|nr:Ankyrin repeat gene family protein [Fowlpox virus]Q9J5I3.1 RecName: Full=Putative ankyrin repeat protein FPV018 [Fowlpox virus strain NVSL]UNS14199.1 ALPV-035 [Albatrosspox virus]WPD90969.1 ankyrin repeat family protein [Avipoxvirus sp.]AAF44362.1 ORF FPV018 Ankyrin repeat gene family protein [Fowlpox virus]QRM13550.1 ankyrin repeat family protein [Fowlpox virus]UHJ14931.1 ankyrin repeat family protein [Fowlpox virus]
MNSYIKNHCYLCITQEKIMTLTYKYSTMDRLLSLHNILKENNVDRLRELIESDKDVINMYDSNRLLPLHIAIEHSDIEIVEMLLDNNAVINGGETIKTHPINIAMILAGGRMMLYNDNKPVKPSKRIRRLLTVNNTEKYTKIVKLLIKHGADLKMVCRSYVLDFYKGGSYCIKTGYAIGYSYFSTIPLCQILWEETKHPSLYYMRRITIKCAIRAVNIELVKHFISNNLLADTDTALEDYFLEAVKTNSPKMVKLFLDSGIDINSTICENSHTALYHAVEQENVTLVMLLLNHGADPDIGDIYSMLKYAIMSSKHGVKLFNILVKNGARIRCCNDILIEAICKRYYSIISYILSLPVNYLPISILCMCIYELRNLPITRKLLKKINDINVSCDACNMYPIHAAVSINTSRLTRLLINKGADVNVRNRYGKTPIHLACMYSKIGNIKVLIKNGANVNERDNYGITPLMICSREGKVSNMEYLLANGADVNQTDYDKNTALTYAIRNKSKECTRVLLEHGADMCFMNRFHTPITIHKTHDNPAVFLAVIYLYFSVINDSSIRNKQGFVRNMRFVNNHKETKSLKDEIENELSIMKDNVFYTGDKKISLYDVLILDKLDDLANTIKRIRRIDLKQIIIFRRFIKKHIKYMEKRNSAIESVLSIINEYTSKDHLSRWWLLSPEIHRVIVSNLSMEDLKTISGYY